MPKEKPILPLHNDEKDRSYFVVASNRYFMFNNTSESKNTVYFYVTGRNPEILNARVFDSDGHKQDYRLNDEISKSDSNQKALSNTIKDIQSKNLRDRDSQPIELDPTITDALKACESKGWANSAASYFSKGIASIFDVRKFVSSGDAKTVDNKTGTKFNRKEALDYINSDGVVSYPVKTDELSYAIRDEINKHAEALIALHDELKLTAKKLNDDDVIELCNQLVELNEAQPIAGNYFTGAHIESVSSYDKDLLKMRGHLIHRIAAPVLTTMIATVITLGTIQSINGFSSEGDNDTNEESSSDNISALVGTAATAVIALASLYTSQHTVNNFVNDMTSAIDGYYYRVNKLLLEFKAKEQSNFADKSEEEEVSVDKEAPPRQSQAQSGINFQDLPDLEWGKIPKDGNCFFDACRCSIQSWERHPDSLKEIKDVYSLRLAIANYIEKNPKEFEDKVVGEAGNSKINTLEEYITNLKTDKASVGSSQYGGEFELVALQALINQPIVVIDEYKTRVHIYGEIGNEADVEGRQPIFLLRSDGNGPGHYDVYYSKEKIVSEKMLTNFKQLGLSITYASVNDAFAKICENVAPSHSMSGKELQDAIYTNNERLSMTNLGDDHYLALSGYLKIDVVVKVSDSTYNVYKYSEEGNQRRIEVTESDYLVEQLSKKSSDLTNSVLFIQENKGVYTTHCNTSHEDLLNLAQGESPNEPQDPSPSGLNMSR